jgi:hypothetical protein
MRKLLALIVIVLVGGCTASAVAHADGDGSITYTCHGSGLVVMDPYGAPVASVGCEGGPKAYGDNITLYAPGTTTCPALVLSPLPPRQYYQLQGWIWYRSCAGIPGKWYAPQGTWIRDAYGWWVKS